MIFIVLSVIDNIQLNVYILLGLLGISAIVIILLSPAEAVNKPLDDIEKHIYRKRAMVIWCVELCAAIICIFAKFEWMGECIAMAHAVIAVVLILGNIQLRKKSSIRA